MDAVIYNKIETEADRIVGFIGGLPKTVLNNVSTLKFIKNDASTPRYYLPAEMEIILDTPYEVTNNDSFVFGMGGGWEDNGLRKLTITVTQGRKLTVDTAFQNQQYIEEITFTNGCKTYGSFNSVFSSCTRLVAINGAIDPSDSWFNTPFYSCLALQTIRFVENSIPGNCPMQQSSELTNESLVSIANGLQEGGAKTLSLHSTPKSACGTIMGTVALDESETYHIFTADDNGSVTLADFITNTKGWTLA